MFENPRSGRQARNFTTNVPKILDLKSSSEQIFFRKSSLGAPELSSCLSTPEGTEDRKVNTLPLSILLGYGSFSEVSAARTLFIRFVVRSRIIL